MKRGQGVTGSVVPDDESRTAVNGVERAVFCTFYRIFIIITIVFITGLNM
jgi:hypothetical protein